LFAGVAFCLWSGASFLAQNLDVKFSAFRFHIWKTEVLRGLLELGNYYYSNIGHIVSPQNKSNQANWLMHIQSSNQQFWLIGLLRLSFYLCSFVLPSTSNMVGIGTFITCETLISNLYACKIKKNKIE
jgi:hypothetical protein